MSGHASLDSSLQVFTRQCDLYRSSCTFTVYFVSAKFCYQLGFRNLHSEYTYVYEFTCAYARAHAKCNTFVFVNWYRCTGYY